jgi:hypothetical protein
MSDTNSAADEQARRSRTAVAVAWLVGAGIPLIAIGFGSWLLARNVTAAGPEFLVRYVFGERHMEPLIRGRDVANPADPGADLASDIHDVIARDWSVIGGYFLILFTCSLIFILIMLAFSNSARNLIRRRAGLPDPKDAAAGRSSAPHRAPDAHRSRRRMAPGGRYRGRAGVRVADPQR